MKHLHRFTALLLVLLLAWCLPVQADDFRVATLKEDLTTLEATALVCVIAESCNAPVNYDTLTVNGATGTCSVKAGVFTLEVITGAGGLATGVRISAAYLDADYASQMGRIFGAMLSNMSDIKSLDALAGLDFNAFNTLTASSQSIICDGYRITIAVDPTSATPYSLTLALNSAVPVQSAASIDPVEEARLILGRMNIDVCAAFLYDATTDPNGKLGKSGSYTSKINFARTALDPNATVSVNLGVEQGGSIEVFATAADALARSADVQAKLPIIRSTEYHFVYGNVLLRLSGATSPEAVGDLVTAFIIAVDGEVAPGLNAATPTPAVTPAPTATPAPVGSGEHMALHVENSVNTSVNLKWTTQSGATYKVEYRTPGGEWHTMNSSIMGTGRAKTYTIPSLNAGVAYEFRVTETIKATGSMSSATTGVVIGSVPTATPKPVITPRPTTTPVPTATPRPTATPAPIGSGEHMALRIKSSANTSVTLEWATQSGASYKVEYRLPGGEWRTLHSKLTGTGNSKTYTVPSLDTGATYEFRVTETIKATGSMSAASISVLVGSVPTATPAPVATPTPAPTATPAASNTLKVGDHVTFGSYEQDNQTANGQEPIEWIVLQVEDGQALLISVYALDVYNTYWNSPTWEYSTLRAWLNSAFYKAAFTTQERAAILISTVAADAHPYYTSDPGPDTREKVFCLSYTEANTLLTVSTRKCTATAYARSNRRVYTESGLCYWWLRTPGKPGCGASIVCTDGSFDYDVSYDGFCYGVRPCIRVNADSPLLQKK